MTVEIVSSWRTAKCMDSSCAQMENGFLSDVRTCLSVWPESEELKLPSIEDDASLLRQAVDLVAVLLLSTQIDTFERAAFLVLCITLVIIISKSMVREITFLFSPASHISSEPFTGFDNSNPTENCFPMGCCMDCGITWCGDLPFIMNDLPLITSDLPI